MNTLAKSTNSRSMRYTCLDVRSPDVNFLRKVMSSSRHDGAAYSRHPCRQSADADIVSAFPLSFSTFLENINILRQTSSTWHRILREFCVLKSFQKPVALAGYKNKQCRKQTSVLSGRIVTAYVPLRSATERERVAFLIPCQGLRDYLINFQFTQSRSVSGIHSPFLFYSSVPDAPGRSDSGEYPDSAYAKHLREVSVLRLPNW